MPELLNGKALETALTPNRRQEHRISQKSKNARFWHKLTCLVNDHDY